MKKITNLFRSMLSLMTNESYGKRFGTLLMGILLSSTMLFSIPALQPYCHTSITATDGVTTVYLTCKLVSAGNYEIKIESDVVMAGLGGSFCNVNGVGGYQLNAAGHFVLSSDYKTITCDIASTSGPNLYTPLFVLMPGEKVFNWPADIDWTSTCSGSVVTDTQAPTAFTATKGTIGSSTVELLLNATDDSGSISYTITYGTTTLTTTGTSATQKSYIVTGLTPSTAYSFAVAAKDATGNTATNSPITVTATTTAVPAPSASAPTPTAYSAAKVISIFSDAFTNVAGTDFNPGWSQATTESTIQIGTDNVLKYSNLNYQGTVFGSHVFPLTMKYLHIDVWTADETSLQIYPICWTGTANEAEKSKTLTPITLNQWNSFDIPMTDFTGMGLTMTDVYQFKIVGTGGKTVYLDNIYFYDNTATVDNQAPTAFTATAGTLASDAVELILNATDNSGAISYTISYGSGPTVLTTSGISGTPKSFSVSGLSGSTAYAFLVTAKDATGNIAANSPITVNATTLTAIPAAPTPTQTASNVMSVFSDTYTNIMGPNGWENWYGNTFSTVSLAGNTALKDIAGCCFGVSFNTASINISSMTKLHVDIYPYTSTTMTLGFIAATTTTGTVTPQKVLTLTTGQWNSIDLSLSDLKTIFPTADYTQVKQMSISPVVGTLYLDNLYFYKDNTTEVSSVIKDNGINCYPNPIMDKLNVSAKSEINEVTVRNLVGQTVQTTKVNGLQISIDLNAVASGNYLVTVKLANGQFSTQKLVKL